MRVGILQVRLFYEEGCLKVYSILKFGNFGD